MSTQFNRQSKPGYIQGSTATFGAPYYGLRVMGKIQYATSKGEDYCDKDDYELPNDSQQGSSLDEDDQDRREINIIMVKRGESKCRFTTKVRVAEKY